MKVQDVRKECSAIVGLSLEFSNSEVGSLSHLLWQVEAAIDKAIDQQIALMKSSQNGIKLLEPEDNVPVCIDLKTLKKVQWLLVNMTRVDKSDLFNEAQLEYESDIRSINNSVVCQLDD